MGSHHSNNISIDINSTPTNDDESKQSQIDGQLQPKYEIRFLDECDGLLIELLLRQCFDDEPKWKNGKWWTNTLRNHTHCGIALIQTAPINKRQIVAAVFVKRGILSHMTTAQINVNKPSHPNNKKKPPPKPPFIIDDFERLTFIRKNKSEDLNNLVSDCLLSVPSATPTPNSTPPNSVPNNTDDNTSLITSDNSGVRKLTLPFVPTAQHRDCDDVKQDTIAVTVVSEQKKRRFEDLKAHNLVTNESLPHNFRISPIHGNQLQYWFVHLTDICCLPSFRRMGITQHLFSRLLSLYCDGARFCLEVKSTNTNAINLYQKLGFEHVRTVNNYYGKDTVGFKMVFQK